MKNLISKELLSEVLGYEVENITGMLEHSMNKTTLSYIFKDTSLNDGKRVINVYELAFKCKEWALTKNKCLSSTPYHKELWVCTILGDEMFEADSEPKAIFKACEWILREIND